MSAKMQVTVRLDQKLTMSQQLRQAISLLQYNTLEIKQITQQLIDTNPLLEVEELENEIDPEQAQHFSAEIKQNTRYLENDAGLENIPNEKTLRSHLLEQILLCHFDKTEHLIAENIIDALDDHGYLTMSVESIASLIESDQPISLEKIKQILSVIQSFDPLGVGASNLQECLLLQLDAIAEKDATWQIAYKIIKECYDYITTHNTKAMLNKLKIDQESYTKALLLIRTLTPNPGMNFSSDKDANSEPELYVKKINNKWQVYLANTILNKVKVNDEYETLIKKNKKSDSYHSLKNQLDEAKNFLSGLKRRNDTLLIVGQYILECQHDFLEHGPVFMKPMNINEVSSALNLHESTVSRITSGKYISTPRGIFELKFFFPSHVSTQTGDMCSAVAVKALIKKIIDEEKEDHVVSDEEICVLLKEQGINIARRTIAKYRESMRILPSYQRMRIKCGTGKTENLAIAPCEYSI